MKEPWQMTVKEWKALPDDIKDTFAGEYPPYPYHSNFHLVEVVEAIKRGEPVPLKVFKSFGKNTALELALATRPDLQRQFVGLGMSETMKESWQMTVEEFCLGRVIPPTLSPHWVIPIKGEPAKRFKTKEAAFNWLKKEHNLWVRYAVAEGKSIPAKVLADYPTLQKRHKGLSGLGAVGYRDPTKTEMMRFLKRRYRSLVDGFENEAEVAIWWFANYHYGGQGTNLYEVLSISPYKPGPYSKLEDEGEVVQMMYNDLVAEYAGG